jgi:hypothetical protein
MGVAPARACRDGTQCPSRCVILMFREWAHHAIVSVLSYSCIDRALHRACMSIHTCLSRWSHHSDSWELQVATCMGSIGPNQLAADELTWSRRIFISSQSLILVHPAHLLGHPQRTTTPFSNTHPRTHPRRNQPQRAVTLMATCRRAVHCADCHRQRDRAGRHCPGNIGQVVNDGHQTGQLCTSLPREASPHQTVPRREVLQCSTCVEHHQRSARASLA